MKKMNPTLSMRSGLFAVVTAALLAGCSSVKLDDVPVENRSTTGGTGGAGGAGTTGGAGQSGVTPVDLTKGGGVTAGAEVAIVTHCRPVR